MKFQWNFMVFPPQAGQTSQDRQCGFHAVHALPQLFHGIGVGDPQMAGGLEGRAGHHRNAGLVRQEVRHIKGIPQRFPFHFRP